MIGPRMAAKQRDAVTGTELADLVAHLRADAATAVDPLEIAATLESQGINDAAAGRFGFPDVFSLAAHVYAKVARAPRPAPITAEPWRSKASHHLFRGVLFGLPGLCYVAAAQTLAGPRAMAVIVLSLLLSWTWSEAVAYAGYHWIGRRDRASAARTLLAGFAAGSAAIVPVVLAAALVAGIGAAATGFAVGQVLYLLAATVALTAGAEAWLFGALVPLILGSLYALLVTHGAGPRLWQAAAASVALTVLVAVAATARRRASDEALVTRPVVRTAVGQSAFGLLAGCLLTFATVWAAAGPGPAAVVTVIALPLSLTMGLAELMLYRYRRFGFRLLHRSVNLLEFATAARSRYAAVLAGYLAVLAVVAGAIAALLYYAGIAATTPYALATAVVLGGALFAGLMLRSFRDLRIVLWSFAAALAAEALVLGVSAVLGWGLGIELVQLTVCAVLFAGLGGRGFAIVGRAALHH
jgi:hypothetical protein